MATPTPAGDAGRSRRILRLTSRLIVLDEADRVLLMDTRSPDTSGVSRWITPGGGVDPGESHRDAAIRELHEETGQVISDPGEVVFTSDFEVEWDAADHTHGHAEFYVVRLPHFEVVSDDWTDDEKVDIVESRWWSIDELTTTTEPFEPLNLPGIIRRALNR
ncbi:ADP-ribose pyrophosphatase YjhB (NUDIX family) [Frondihabitans sp. PhB188]|uniref:NUDIX hydrolase n=1 Tax=Frondihabitans sp. PhB188 TaxID=2485200 RepID=UPI000F921A0C|nr:NUDIX domain-containing protein [Frondihabitans sp. PhB188]ROQ40897.1 ADP-ribose pyrophosphatase YjhB (NUDIX family) [Frondihabitans sp. PhB188]